MPISNELRKQRNLARAKTLNSELEKICLAGIEKLEEGGWEPYIVQARRTQEEQNAYYAQGRMPLAEVNRLRDMAGLSPISENENKYKVTSTTFSKHLTGKAFDIVGLTNGEIDWNDKGFYGVAAMVFEGYGLVWGGRWIKMVDFPHFELK